jgi:hypothetical protein
MAAYSPFLRPLGISAGGLGTVQAFTWGILSLLGILLYNGDMEVVQSPSKSRKFEMALASMYFERTPKPFDHMTPATVAFWTSAYFATSVIWLVISCILLYDSWKSRFTSKVLIGWVAVSAVVAAIDFAGFVAFCVDYNRLQKRLDDRSNPISYGVEYLSVPLFMMIMCARGFILWFINVGLVIYLGVAERKLYKKGSQDVLQTVSRTEGRYCYAWP